MWLDKSKVLIILVIIGSLIGISKGSGDEITDHGDVVVLNRDNFDDFINRHELSLVEFYAPWCGHCKQLAPEYKDAAAELLGEIPLANVDATKESELASRFQVGGYPTLKIFRNGKASDYNGPRKAKGIVAYMKKQVGPAAKPITNEEEFNKVLKADKDSGYAIVGFFSSSSTQLHSAYAVLTNKLRDDFSFGKAMNQPELAAKYGIKGEEGIIAFLGDEKFIYEGPSRGSLIEEWARQNSVPLVGEYNEGTSGIYDRRGLPIVKFFMKVDRTGKNEKQMKYWTNRFKKIAEPFKGKIVAAYSDKKSEANQGAIDHYNLKDAEIGVVFENKEQRYRYEEEFDVKKIISWISDALDDKLKNYVRSEIPPKKNDGPVKVVVGSTFQDIVHDPTKDVLIEFYAPWCGHCKQLEPKYKELGEKFKSEPSVVIAKIDATANDFDRESFKVSGYPSIYFVPAKANAKPILYEGSRDIDDMYNFVLKKAKSELKSKKAKPSKKKKKVVIEDDDDEDDD